jgi:hypothetical protein
MSRLLGGVPDRGCAQRDFRAFAPDTRRLLTAVRPLAFVRDELFLDEGVCVLRSAYRLWICRELGIAIFTQAKHRHIILSFDDPKPAFRHASSSPQSGLD